MNQIDMDEEKVFEKDVRFSDDEGNLYVTYLSLREIRLEKPSNSRAKDLVLLISKESFPLKDYEDCFTEEKDDIVLDLDKLLGIKDRLQSQVLTFLLRGEKEEKITRIVFLNRYVLLKDPRRKENQNHMTVLLNTLVLDYLYKKEKNKSNLKVKIDGKQLYFLLEDKDC